MTNNKHDLEKGFSLVELLTVIAIIGIIAAFALPSYQGTVLKGRRADGQTIMLDVEAKQGKLLYTNGTYATDLKTLGYAASSNVVSNEGYYKVSVLAATGTCPITVCYVIQVTPQVGQVKDGIMELTSTGIKRRDKNNDGDFTDAGEDSWK